MLRGTEMGLHLDEKLQKVQSLVSRTQALAPGSRSSLENAAVCVSFQRALETRLSFFTSTIWETQGFSGQLLFKTNWNLEASQTFFG